MIKESRLEVGRILCGKWRIDGLLGEGGMATVWSGTHRNGMRVAIKALRAEVGGSPEIRERFLREGYVANHIGHDGVVTILDDDVSEDGVVFLVMELLEGMTLKEMWMERHRALLPSEVVAVTRAVLDVLAAAHDKGVVHRDLKPDNVFLLSSGGVRILDFGIARLREIDVVDQRTRTGSMLGTPAFMPPEQALGHWDDVDARSDLWAVGATMWTLLTGRLVHKAKTVQELLVAAATARAVPIHEVIPELDHRLAAVIDRALSFDRADRWQKARAMYDALEPLTQADAATDVLPSRSPDSGVGAHGSWNSVGAQAAHPTPTATMDTPTHLMAPAGERVAPETLSHDTATPTTHAVSAPRRRRLWPLMVLALVVAAAGVAAVQLVNDEVAPRNVAGQVLAPSVEAPLAAPLPSAPPSSMPSAQPAPSSPPVPTPRRTFPIPRPPPPPPPRPALDCAGKDFSNPRCAR